MLMLELSSSPPLVRIEVQGAAPEKPDELTVMSPAPSVLA